MVLDEQPDRSMTRGGIDWETVESTSEQMMASMEHENRWENPALVAVGQVI